MFELQPELGVTRCWIFWTSYRASCGFWTVHRVIGHHIACFGLMDYI